MKLSDAKALHGLSKGVDTEPLIQQEETELVKTVAKRPRTSSELPLFENTGEQDDNLFDVCYTLISTFTEQPLLL